MPTKNAQPTSQNKNAATGPKLPVKTFRLGRIKAAVWENEVTKTNQNKPSSPNNPKKHAGGGAERVMQIVAFSERVHQIPWKMTLLAPLISICIAHNLLYVI